MIKERIKNIFEYNHKLLENWESSNDFENMKGQIDKTYMDWFEKMIDEEIAELDKYRGDEKKGEINGLIDLKSKLKQENSK